MGSLSNIRTMLAVDPAISLGAKYRFNNADRLFIDEQIRATQQHVVDSLISGVVCTWATLDGASAAAAIGDAVALKSNVAGGAVYVTRALTAALTAAGSVMGIAMTAAQPGGLIRIALRGLVPSAITGLGATAGYVRVNGATARAQRVASLTTGDFVLGTVDAFGNLTLNPIGTDFTGITWANDLAGSTNSSQSVVQLTGSGGIVTLASGTKVTSAIAGVGDVFTAVGTTLQFGSVTPSSLIVGTTTRGINIFNGSGGMTLRSATTETIAIGTSSADNWQFVVNNTSGSAYLKLDAGSGLTYSSTGIVRIPNYSSLTEVITARTGGTTNAPILKVNGTGATFTIGDGQAWTTRLTGYDTLITGDGSGSGSVVSITNYFGAQDITAGKYGLEYIRLSSGALVTALNRANTVKVSATEMPTNTGSGVTFFGSATTVPTASPTLGAILWHETANGLHYSGPSTQFADFMIAPVMTGSGNSQFNKSWQYAANVRTTNATTTTILTLPLATSGTNGCFEIVVTGRDQTGGTPVDGVSFSQLAQFKNNAGTVSAAATQATQLKANDTSMAACTLTYAVSGTNVLVQVTGLSGVTIDWTAYATAITN